jgi:hypothetical protein
VQGEYIASIAGVQEFFNSQSESSNLPAVCLLFLHLLTIIHVGNCNTKQNFLFHAGKHMLLIIKN